MATTAQFCIIDGKLLINGSFNWTYSAASKNEENIVITNHADLVEDFVEHFSKMWANDEHFQTVRS